MDDATWAWIEPALKAGRDSDTREDIEAQIATGRAQLWLGEGGALVTQLIKADHGRFVHCWLGGGSLRALLDMRGGVEAWGRAMGCDQASIDGRKGWDRVFARFGYKRAGDELRKAL
jgi:hypothetical protein